MDDNPIERLKKLSRERSLDYDDILIKWKNSNIKGGIFTDHLLVSLTSEVNLIEGINVSYNNTKEVLSNGTVANYSGDIRDLYSVLNNAELASFLNISLEIKTRITPEFIKTCHKLLMFGSIDNKSYNINKERAGEFKKADYCVGKFNVGVEPDEVEYYITDLCNTINSYDSPNILKLGTAFHCYFESIHPFSDGNGRLGRWLLNYLLVLNNHPPVVIRSSNRNRYYTCLEKFDEFEDLEPMYEFLKETTVESYGSYSYLLSNK